MDTLHCNAYGRSVNSVTHKSKRLLKFSCCCAQLNVAYTPVVCAYVRVMQLCVPLRA